MTSEPNSGAAPATTPSPESSALAFIDMARGFWSGETKTKAWLLVAGVFLLLLCNLGVNVGINRWNRWFFDALERKDSGGLLNLAAIFAGLIVAGAAFAVAMTRVRMTLQLRWREWITMHLLGRWLSDQRYYKLAISDETATSPESRICDDVRLATEPVVDFVTGFTNAVLSAATFISILFVVGGSIEVRGMVIPGYIALAALLYAAASSTLTYFVGHPLTASVDRRNEAEAQFRFGMASIRENVESIALIRGDADELRRMRESFGDIIARTIAVIRNTCNLTWVLNANTFLAATFALLLAAPKYLSGDMTLGSVMQVGSAFTAVLSALNWFTENYIAVAQWRASARRVALLHDALEAIDFDRRDGTVETHLAIEESSGDLITLEGVSLSHRNGKVVVDDADLSIAPGERVLLAGESGTGKSTLVRAVAGLWPWGEGKISLPAGAAVGFVPQRPYIPLGTLRDALAYPLAGDTIRDDEAKAVLKDTGLTYMIDHLDRQARLDQTLSGGERQRIAFARLLLQKPRVIVMDEATAALDVDSESRLLNLLFERLPEATVLSVGHRPALEELHTRKVTLRREASGARIEGSAGMRQRLWRAILMRRRRSSQKATGIDDVPKRPRQENAT